MANTDAAKVLADLCDTIDAAGGLEHADDDDVNGRLVPVGDPDWIDLAEVYLAACDVLGREPLIS